MRPMQPRPHPRSRLHRTLRWLVATALAAALHAALLLWLLPLDREPAPPPTVVETLHRPRTSPDPTPDLAPRADEAARAEAAPPANEAPTPAPAARVEEPPRAEEADPPEEAARAEEPPRPDEAPRQSVYQPALEQERPDRANFYAEVDNRTDVETMARQTTVDDAAPEPEAAGDQPTLLDEAGQPEEQQTPDARGDADEARQVADRTLGEGERDAPEGAADADPDGANADSEHLAAGAGEDALDQQAVEAETGGETVERVGLAPSETEHADRLADPTRPGDAPSAASGFEALSLGASAQRARQAAEAAQAGGTAVGRAGGVDSGAYVAVFGDRNARDLALVEQQVREATIAGDHQGRWERTRAALENFDVIIQPGDETQLNTHANIAAGYIHHLHNKIHTPWRAYLSRLDLGYGADHAVSDLSIAVELEYVIASNGAVNDVRIRDGSGSLMFDAEAVDLFYRIGPHEPPPPGLRSGDGNTYIVWLMRRDDRACSTSHASVRWRDMGGEVGGG